MDRPGAGGFLSLTAALPLRVVVSPLWAMNIKSALRDLLSVPYGMISILVISRYAAPPYPAAPDFLHRKACHAILRSLCSLTNRVPLPPHLGDRINRSMLSCRDIVPWLSIHSPTTKWGEGGGASHQRGENFLERSEVGLFSLGRSPVVRLYHKRAPSINLEVPPQPSRRRRVKLKNPRGDSPVKL